VWFRKKPKPIEVLVTMRSCKCGGRVYGKGRYEDPNLVICRRCGALYVIGPAIKYPAAKRTLKDV
jgi:hypothetical protein